ncbi:hypothetical protein WA158_000272 [Blastocystis sp. Blastoise]
MDRDITRYCLKKGYLVKEGHLVKTWKNRLFVLTSSELSYMEGDKVKGKIPLNEIKTVQPTKLDENEFGFEITTSEEFGKDFIVYATSNEDRQQWIDAILAAKEGRPLADSTTQVFTKIEDDSLADPTKYYDYLLTALLAANDTEHIESILLRLAAFYTRCADNLFFTYEEMCDYRGKMMKIIKRREEDWKRMGNKTGTLDILLDDMKSSLESSCERLNIHNGTEELRNTLIPAPPTGNSTEKRMSRGIPKKGFSDIYIMKDMLGSGAFSVVYKCVNKMTGVEYAVKVMKKNKMKQSDLDSIKNEVYLLGTLDHPNIVRLEAFYDESDNYYIVTELADGGELFDEIVNRKFYSEIEARKIVYTLLQALDYIHSRNIAHRDLKPENILLSKETKEIKLADFGFAKSTEDTDTGRLMTDCGSPWYVAPEILQNHLYGTQVDMWSLGVIIFILLCGYPPFHDENQARLFKRIKNGSYKFDPAFWDHISEHAKNLIQHLLVVDPSKRYDCKQCLNHPWFKEDNESISHAPLNVAQHELKSFNIERRGVYKQGYLIKQGHIIKNWKKRSFVLTSEELRYYKSETEKKPQEYDNDDSSFIIRTITKKDFYIKSPNSSEREEWVLYINIIRRCNKMKSLIKFFIDQIMTKDALDLLWETRRQRHMAHDYSLLKLWSYLYIFIKEFSVGSIYMIQGFEELAENTYTYMTSGTYKEYKTELLENKETQMETENTRVIAGDLKGHIYIYDNNNDNILNKQTMDCAISTIKTCFPMYICIAGGEDGSISFIDLYTMQFIETIHGHETKVTYIDIEMSTNRFITGDEEGNLILWDLQKRKNIKKQNFGHGSIVHCQFLKEGRNICIATKEGYIYLVDTLTFDTIFIYGINKPITGIFIYTNNSILVCCSTGDIYIYKEKNKEIYKHYLTELPDINKFVVSVDERYILLYGKYICIYNLITGIQEAYMDIKTEINACCTSPIQNIFYINQSINIEKWYIDMVLEAEGKKYTPPNYSTIPSPSDILCSPSSVPLEIPPPIEEVKEE